MAARAVDQATQQLTALMWVKGHNSRRGPFVSTNLKDQVSAATRLRDKLKLTVADVKRLLRDTETLLDKSRRP